MKALLEWFGSNWLVTVLGVGVIVAAFAPVMREWRPKRLDYSVASPIEFGQ